MMMRLSSTIAQLARFRTMAHGHSADPVPDRLDDLLAFGSNPGALRARTYVPANLAKGAALVVVLHGCTQNAAGYDHAAGWSHLADEQGFALLFPEQQRSNNPNLCFNWFSPVDSWRDSGEALSIRQMIDTMVATHGIDQSRIFVTGLSAGGAMTSIMLACYPELFAGGAIIAGLPFGCAASVNDAFARMRGEGYPADDRLPELVKAASGHQGPWPTISVWQGSADQTVAPSNADRILAQWQSLHGVDSLPSEQTIIDGSPRRTWRDKKGRAAIESYEIIGMGHGTPLNTVGPDGHGNAAPYMLEAGISSTGQIAQAWGLMTATPARKSAPTPGERIRPQPMHARKPTPKPAHKATGVSAIIEDALRKAGLMR
ncbi:poly(hydroxyalkanoate) depolymerase family esterase [Sphingobium xenophagum]|uniref:Poly(Hydroxyalkanoate) depolymerase family esterase n=1 Tax=Sphingobium xenophagum TaxID=121428 RepID=A0ABU1X5W4_SPHXE|nr:PHB depolymerase family esterase [Sphingobium xenophagum]MDR7156975.1 poly(hydroxyalkanoate) depolymerase family esterase [Sphingobium xenophagum]